MAIVAGVSTSFVDPKLSVLEGNETTAGVMPASNIQVKAGLLAEVKADPDGSGSTEVTGDPKVYSYPNDPKDGTANIVFERYYYTRTGGTPAGPFRSVIQSFDSSLLTTTAAVEAVINDGPPNFPANQYLTDWGGGSPTPANSEVVNAYGVVRLGDYVYVMSYDTWRVTQIDASTKAVVGAITFDYSKYTHGGTPPATVMARGQGIKVHEGHLYTLFNVAEDINGTTVASANYQPSVLVEIDTANFSFKDNNKAQADRNYVEVGLNSVKIEGADGFLYCPAIGGPQLAGQSNITRSGLYRVPVDASGVLGAAAKAYQGRNDSTFYDIRDIAVGENYAVILIGRFSATYDSFTYALLKIMASSLSTVAAGTDIYTLYSARGARFETGTISGYGPFHTVRYEKLYKHFWCGQSSRIEIYDESSIASSSPAPGQTINSQAFYGGAGFINSMEIFIDNAEPAEEAHAVQKMLRAVPMAAHAGLAGGAMTSLNIERAILEGHIKAAKPEE
jgi:hypothetical protein